MEELFKRRSDEDFQRLFSKVARLVGVKSLDEASAAKRKRTKLSSISAFIAYSQVFDCLSDVISSFTYIESINIGERIDDIRQAIKEQLIGKILKNL